MRPTAARSNRSSVYHPRSSPIPSPSTTSVYHQPQQQILYAPISNPMVTLQPCGTVLHPSYVYPSVQSHIGSPNSAALHLQGKNNRWHSKNKPSRGQLYYQQQQPLSCNPKPVVLLDQPSSSIAPIPSSTTSYLVASSTFAHAEPLSSQHYNNSGVTHLLPQSFNFKPSNVQTFCLIQDRQNAQQQQQQHPMQASYYNISATNTCSLQTVNANSSFPLPSNINPYTNLATFNTNQFPMTVRSSPLFTNPPVGLILAPTRKDNKSLPVLDLSPVKHDANKTPSSVCESQVVPVTHSDNFNSWPPQIETSAKNSCDAHTASNNKSLESADRDSQKPISAKTDEEHYSDESSISFDFTIEAEKMVSALCNTTSSNDLNKEESKPDNKTDSAALFSGAGDNVSNRTNWFTDFCSEYENGTSIGVQTDAYPNTDRSQYPELIRKTAYWGCTEAEIVLGSNNSQTDDSKQTWLTCLSSATRTAITKSSICIPVFAGDRVLANDLINALLRISNGWLSLDNYLNKQHFPNLFDRLEPELIACFHTWEESTCQLLKQIVRTFQKFGENNEVTDEKYNTNCESSSFPGDVSLYMNYNLFAQPSSSSFTQQNTVRKASSREYLPSVTSTPLSTSSLHNFQYTSDQQEQQSAAQKESKLRSKWTITENLSSMINTTKSVPNVYHATDIGGLANTKLRTKNASTSRKIESSQKSLNAEFCQLRDKVMVSNVDAAKQDRRQARKLKFRSETKHSGSHNNTDQSTMNTPPLTYSGLYAQNSSSFTFPLSSHPSSSSYPGSNPGILIYSGHPSSSDYSYPITDINSKSSRNSEQNYGSKSANIHSAYVGRPQTDQTEFPTVPRNKMTLLSQIEPRTFDKESKEMAANLSAWFASMRNAQPPATTSTFEEFRMNENSESRLFAQQEMPKFSTQSKQPQIDANRQFQALQNLPNIQSTPWAAANFVNRHQTTQHAPEEYDSSEDVRVYMKPGSYNVPRKRHQRRSNRRQSDNSNATSRNASSHYNVGSKGKNISILASSTPLSHANAPTISNSTLIKTSFPPASQLPAPLFDLENSPRILKHAESLSQDAHQDITWKAACASAEILLEALNVKDSGNTCKKIDCNDNNEKDDKNKNNETSQQNDLKLLKHNSVDYASSYEASEDDSGSTCKLSPNTSVLSASQLCEEENGKNIAVYYS